MTSNMILVTGANGRTGRAVVRAIMARGGLVRGLVRQPAHADALVALGAEAALGDLETPDSLAAACEGCATVVHIGPPMHAREVEITTDLLQAAAQAGVKHFVYYSVMQTLRQDVFHHRQKLIAEAAVVESGLPYTILQPIRYMQHLAPIWPQVRDHGVHAMPFRTTVRFNVVDLRDLADAAAIVVTEPGHLNATYELAGPDALSSDDMAAIIADVLGRAVTASAFTPDAAEANARAKGFDAERIARMAIMNLHYDRYGFLGNANVLRWLLHRKPRGFRDYVRDLANGTT